MDDIRARADARLEQALAAAGVEDPRPACRDRLKALRAENPAAFARAVDYYEHRLLAAIAGGAEPLSQWVDYARVLAEAAGDGRVVMVDATGRARPYDGAVAPGAGDTPAASALVLFLPQDARRGALPLLLPAAPTAAQQASLDLLVGRRRES